MGTVNAGINFCMVQRFNTGRGYSAAGQPIAWATFEDTEHATYGIVFHDEARGISGVLPMPGDPGVYTACGNRTPITTDENAEVGQAYIMSCYDGFIRHEKSCYEVERLFCLKLANMELLK